ncbi:hypothetical protein J27TS7_48250 [Paenibacillus dendritiformis]|nr:hypothetical protein J27TS7_48250 [Paenibacillus dendritiformis]
MASLTFPLFPDAASLLLHSISKALPAVVFQCSPWDPKCTNGQIIWLDFGFYDFLFEAKAKNEQPLTSLILIAIIYTTESD